LPACRHRVTLLLTVLGLAAPPGATVMAQPSTDEQQMPGAVDADPPTRAARLSYVEGAVSVQPVGIEEWSAASINRPLTSGDQLWSDRASRAEIDLGSAILSVADSSFVALLDLGAGTVRLRVSAGRANVALHDSDPDGSFEIDAPNAAVSLMRPGSYRIDVDSAGNTTVAMRDGQAQIVSSSGQSVILRGGQGAQFGPNGAVEVAPLGPADDFDRWCARREQRWSADRGTTEYVSSDVVGSQDLADNGDWSDEPDYGYVWYPTQVAPDWAPYRYGRWLWITPWGWTWVDNAAWGYAPFHYGRWAYLRQRWAWVPAPPGAHAVYAPALVAWVGGTGVTAVGWLPLAPGEVYLPGHRVSARYLQEVNRSNTRIVDNGYISSVYQNPAVQHRYANRDMPRAVSVVSQSSFASGQPITPRIIAPPPQWSAAAARPRPPAIAPAAPSALGALAQSPVKQPPIAFINRPVLARHEPPPAPPRSASAPPAASGTSGMPRSAATPVTVVAPQTPVTPVTSVVPAANTNATRLAPAATAIPAPSRATPIDRRVIPERSPQYQPPAQSLPSVQSQALRPSPPVAQPEPGPGLPVGPRREVESFAPPPPPPSAPAPAAAVPQVKAKPAPQVERPEGRKVEPP
jgi:hypothetical protein